MTDVSFRASLRRRYHDLGRFGHREHLHLCWSYLRRDEAAAPRAIRSFIREVAEAHGTPERYHETITAFWIEIVRRAIAGCSCPDDFDGLLAAHPQLLDSSLAQRHFSRERLFGAEARARHVDPDLRPV